MAASLDVDLIVAADHGQPFEVLGPHLVRERGAGAGRGAAAGPASLAIRAFVAKARSMSVVRDGVHHAMKRLHAAGFFEAVFAGETKIPAYQLTATYGDGRTLRFSDPYALPPVLGDLDLHLFQEGTHYTMYERFGAQTMEHAGHRGVSFAVWAPNAKRVSVIGSFNGWDERVHPMRLRGESGVWELFIPGVKSGELYKYHIRTKIQNANSVRSDPVAFFMEQRPNTASIVWDRRKRFRWRDAEWIASRPERQGPHAPISIYEVHLGSWRRVQDGRPAPHASLAAGVDPGRAVAGLDRIAEQVLFHGASRDRGGVMPTGEADADAGTGEFAGAGKHAAGKRKKRGQPGIVPDAGRTEAGRWLSYRELARTLVPYAKKMGYTHLELLPVTEHPFDGSWGYQTAGYFAPTSRFGTPDDFKFFVDAAHHAGLGVILDWVPAHFPRDGHGLAFFDGTHLYDHADPRKGQHQDWGTFIFNYGRVQVVEFLLSSAAYWFEEFHLDGMRVDAVASMLYLNYSRKPGEWVPNEQGGPENWEAVEFLRKFNKLVHTRFPGALTFAEESTSWPGVSHPVQKGGLGFDLKWNMGWMNDTLQYVKEDPLARKHHQGKLTFSIMYAFSEHFILPLSHDEVVHGKRSLLGKVPGDPWKKRATQRALLGYMYAHPGKKLLFMGMELGQQREWHHDRQLDWDLLNDPEHGKLQRYVRELNRLYVRTPALHELDFDSKGFEWSNFRDEARSVIAFVRRARSRKDFVVIAINWTPVPWEKYRVGVPAAGTYRLLWNSDAAKYGGTGAVLPRTRAASRTAAGEYAFSIEITLPPLAILMFAPVA